MAEGISLAKELIEFDPEKKAWRKRARYTENPGSILRAGLEIEDAGASQLALAQGFRKGYRFIGNKTQVVKQIGNAVPRRLAERSWQQR